MAMVILGTTKCPICDQVFLDGSDVVAFSWFETDCDSLRVFSDAGVHFSCLKNHPNRSQLQTIFLQQMGDDGVYANGRHVLTISPSVKIAFDSRQVVIGYGPLFLMLEMPRKTASAWKASRFFEHWSDHFFAEKGFEAIFKTKDASWECLFRFCPYAFTPSQAMPSLVRSAIRVTTIAEGKKTVEALHDALNHTSG